MDNQRPKLLFWANSTNFLCFWGNSQGSLMQEQMFTCKYMYLEYTETDNWAASFGRAPQKIGRAWPC